MGDLDRIITYTFNMKDNVSTTTDRITASTNSAQTAVDDLTEAESGLDAQATQTTKTLESQQITVMTQLTALMGLRSAVSAVTSGLRTMGLVSDEDAEKLQKVNGAFALFAGAVTAIKSVQAVMTTLNASTALYATLQTYLQGLKNPLLLGGALIGAAGAGAIGGYFLTQNNTSNNTSFNITNSSPSATENIKSEVYNVGALK